MARIRTDFFSGTLSSAIADSATTITSSALATFPVVASPDTAYLVLGADTTAPEIVVVTAHTSESTSATVTRAQDDTSAQSWATGTSVIQAPVASDLDTANLLELETNTQTGTTYTLVLADAGKVVEMNNGSANTLTVPPNSSVAFPVGTVVEVYNMGAGITTVAAGSGVTVRNAGDLSAQYATASLRKRATDEWVLTGSLA